MLRVITYLQPTFIVYLNRGLTQLMIFVRSFFMGVGDDGFFSKAERGSTASRR